MLTLVPDGPHLSVSRSGGSAEELRWPGRLSGEALGADPLSGHLFVFLQARGPIEDLSCGTAMDF